MLRAQLAAELKTLSRPKWKVLTNMTSSNYAKYGAVGKLFELTSDSTQGPHAVLTGLRWDGPHPTWLFRILRWLTLPADDEPRDMKRKRELERGGGPSAERVPAMEASGLRTQPSTIP